MSEWIYGRHAVVGVLTAGRRRSNQLFLLHDKGEEALSALAKQHQVPVQVVPPAFFSKRLPAGSVHQGVLLEAEPYSYVAFEELLDCTGLLLLDEIQDPQNLGALIRSALLLGMGGVVISSVRGAGVEGGCLKASSGACELLPIARVSSIANALERLKEHGFWSYGADPGATKLLYDEVFPAKVALVIGNEGKGLRHLVKERCDILLQIPMKAAEGVDSLNASVTGAIMGYELARQRGKK